MSCNAKLLGMCRLCGTSSGQALVMKNVLCEEDPEVVGLTVAIQHYTGIMVSSEDNFPKEVCDSCFMKIKSFEQYTEECANVQKLFVKLITGDPDEHFNHEIPVKSEPVQEATLSLGVKNENDNNILVKLELDDMDDDIDDNIYHDDGIDYPISDLFPKKRKKLKDSKKKSKKHKSKLKISSNLDKEDKKPKSIRNLNKFFSFACFVCEDQMANWFKLKTHLQQIHKERAKVECSCGYVVKSKTALYRHVQSHNDPTSFYCDKCSRVTKSQAALDRHKMSHLPKPERVFACASCPRMFQSKENLRSHERVHLPLIERYNYPCTICGNKFTTKSAVVGHTRAVHEKIKRYICDVCGYACSTGGELLQHRAIHSDDKLFQCSKCPKKFKTSSNLNAHLDTHDDTSYPCDMCDKVLNSRRTYRKHLLVHDDLCRHVCPFCNKAFKRRQTLKVHLTCHTGDTPVQCPWCPQKFAYSSACRTHKQRCHPDEFLLQQQQMQQQQPASATQGRQDPVPTSIIVTRSLINTAITTHFDEISIDDSESTKNEDLKLHLELNDNQETIVS